MDLAKHFRKLFEYDAWANREAMASLKKHRNPSARSVKVMAHIVAAEWLWIDRLRAQKQRLAVWPELTVAESDAELTDLPELWRHYLASVAERLDASVHYVNTKGETWSSTIHDVLTHVVFHSAYHRGQIAMDLRAAGLEPPYTDYIHATRKGLLKDEG